MVTEYFFILMLLVVKLRTLPCHAPPRPALPRQTWPRQTCPAKPCPALPNPASPSLASPYPAAPCHKNCVWFAFHPLFPPLTSVGVRVTAIGPRNMASMALGSRWFT